MSKKSKINLILKRWVALMIDNIITFALFSILLIIFLICAFLFGPAIDSLTITTKNIIGFVIFLISVIVPPAIYILFKDSIYFKFSSVGKKAMGLVLVYRKDGEPVRPKTAFFRTLINFPLNLFLPIDYLGLLFGNNQQKISDMILNVEVIEKGTQPIDKPKKVNQFKIIIVLLIFCILPSIIIIFYKPTSSYNQHPMPNLLGTEQPPEYLVGGCSDNTSSSNEDNLIIQSENISLKSSISLDQLQKKIIDKDEYEDLNLILTIIDRISKTTTIKELEANFKESKIKIIIEYPKGDWQFLNWAEKIKLQWLQLIEKYLSDSFDSYEMQIRTCEGLNSQSTWVGYISNTSGENILRFDWRESIWEQFLRKLRNNWR